MYKRLNDNTAEISVQSQKKEPENFTKMRKSCPLKDPNPLLAVTSVHALDYWVNRFCKYFIMLLFVIIIITQLLPIKTTQMLPKTFQMAMFKTKWRHFTSPLTCSQVWLRVSLGILEHLSSFHKHTPSAENVGVHLFDTFRALRQGWV